jgi:hypothetical protein
LKKLLIVLGVLAALLVAADVGARLVSEQALAADLQRTLHLPDRPSVSLTGFPFLVHLFAGDVPTLTVEASGIHEGSVGLDRVVVTLSNLRFSVGRLFGGNLGTVRAAGGAGTARMTADQLEAALKAAGLPATVRLVGGDRIALSGGGFRRPVQARLAVHGTTLDVTPVTRGLTPPLSLGLPDVIQGLRYTAVHVDDGGAVLAFRLDHPSITL